MFPRMWKWWRSSQGYCTLWALAVIVVFLYMAFSIEPRLSPTARQDQKDRAVGTSQSEPKDSANDNQSLESLWQSTTHDPVALFTFWLVVATGALAIVAAGQAALFLWQLGLMREGLEDAKTAASAARDGAFAARDNVEIAKLTMVARDRAYVHHGGFRWISHPSGGDFFWRIRPQWINSGNTPTRNMGSHVDYSLRDHPLPEDFVFSYVRGDIPAMIPPHGQIEGGHRDISADDLLLIRDGKKFFYAWGTADYRDVFPDTPDRVTKFCAAATNISGDPHKAWHATENPLEIMFAVYHRHNCTDEDCN